MNQTVSFGIWGCGMIAAYHAKAILELPDCRLVGAFDANPESGKKFCDTFSIRCFESAEELLSSPEIDAICICLPSGLHFSCALSCIVHHKHVVIEKPMVFTTAEADELIAKADEAGVKISVIFQLRHTEAVTAMKQAVEQGWFGRITSVELSMKFYRAPEYYRSSSWKGTLKMDGGGALMNQGIHGIDLLQYLLGPIVSVQALSATLFHSIETEDTLAALVEFENGALGTIQATTSVYPGFPRRLEICGTEGSASFLGDMIQLSLFQDPSHQLPIGTTTNETGNRPDGMDHTLHRKQLADFAEALRQNRPPYPDAREGKKAIAIIEAIYLSAKNGEKILL